MPSGWTRWILEQFEFPFTVVYPSRLDAGNLRDQFDVLIFVTGAIPSRDTAGEGNTANEGVPAEYQDRMGSVSIARTVPQLKAFLEAGGTILTIGSSTSLAAHLGLPLTNPLVEQLANGTTRPLPREKYYLPGSILEGTVDVDHPLAFGVGRSVHFVFDNSPVFQLLPEAARIGIQPVAWFGDRRVLRSGWAWGEHYLAGQIAVAEAPVGRGRLVLFGPEIAFRAQPHGTFPFLFNGIFLGGISS